MLATGLLMLSEPPPLGDLWSSPITFGNENTPVSILSNGTDLVIPGVANGLRAWRSTDLGFTWAANTIDAGYSAPIASAAKPGTFALGRRDQWKSADGLSWTKTAVAVALPGAGSGTTNTFKYVDSVLWASRGGDGVAKEVGNVFTSYSVLGESVQCVACEGMTDGCRILAGVNNVTKGLYGATMASGAPGTWAMVATAATMGLSNELGLLAYGYSQFFASGMPWPASSPTVLRGSINKGVSWTTRLNTAQPIMGIFISPEAGGIFVYCAKGFIYRSIDFGFTFQLLSTGLAAISQNDIYGMAYIQGVLLAVTRNKTIIRSTY